MFPVPHGAVCAALLPHVMETNLHALRTRDPQNPALPRFEEIAHLLTGDAHASAADGVNWTRRLVIDLGISGLRSYGIRSADTAAIVEAAGKASSMKANPLPLTSAELANILTAAL
jgi:alcohol dehydrogenase class IV